MSPTQPVARAPEPKGATLTGWHVLAMLVAYFGVMFVANGFLVYYALGTFSGTVTDSSYQASQEYNLYIAASRAQELRNWHVAADARRTADGQVVIRVIARDADNIPVGGTDFLATLQRPATRSQDRQILLMPNLDEPGVYVGSVAGIASGQWDLMIAADTDKTPANDAVRADQRESATGFHPHLFQSLTRLNFK